MIMFRMAGAASGALLLLPLALAAQAPRPALAEAAAATSPAITEGDLRARIAAFAHDSAAGRLAGTAAHDAAAAYIAAELERIGAEPAGENGTYFQALPLERRRIDPATRLVVGGRELELWTDFVPVARGTVIRRFAGMPVVFGGSLGGTDVIATEETVGRVVVFDVEPGTRPSGIPSAGEGGSLPDAAAVILTGVDPMLPGYARYLSQPRTRLGGGEPSEGGVTLMLTSAAAAGLFDSPLDSLAVGAAGQPVEGGVVLDVEPTPSQNVIAVVRGSDPALAGQYVAYGSHSDHIGTAEQPVDHDSLRAYNRVVRPLGAESRRREPTAEEALRIRELVDSLRQAGPARADSINNGADDDASGSMGMLEIAERFATAAERPRRSLLFVWHTAEEAGLLGSEWFTDRPTVPRDSIVAQINLDMIGRGSASDTEGGGPDFLQLLGSRRLSSEFGDLVETVNAGLETPFRLDYSLDADGHPLMIYCRSDHWNYARYGIPIVFFTTGSHQDYHQLSDETQYIDFPHLTAITRYLADLGAAAADLDHRLVVDQAVPGPDAECVQ